MAAKLQRDPWTTPTQGKQLPFYAGGPNQYPRAQQPQQNFDPNSDIRAIFEGIRQNQGMVRRGMSGNILNPDGTDPGSSFNQFLANNPHLATPELRQQQYARENQQRYDNINQQGAAAVDFMKQQQAQTNPNLVTGADGYRTLFDPRNPGKVLGTTAPISRTIDNAVNRGTASPDEMNVFRQEMQQAGERSIASQPPKSAPTGMNMLFPSGGAQQISPPGGGVPGRVGAGMLPGEPGGGTMPQWVQDALVKPEMGYRPSVDTSKVVNAPAKPIAQAVSPQPQGEFVGPVIPQNYLPAPQAPYGTTGKNKVPNVKGLVPRVNQGLSEIGANVSDWWSSLFGEPQNAYEEFLRNQTDLARQQYRKGIR